MDLMFTKYKEEFISAIKGTLDLYYNDRDVLDLKFEHNKSAEKIEEPKYKELLDNIQNLEHTLKHYTETGTLTPDEQRIAVAALGTTAVHFDYLADKYAKASRHAKIIIGNIQNIE